MESDRRSVTVELRCSGSAASVCQTTHAKRIAALPSKTFIRDPTGISLADWPAIGSATPAARQNVPQYGERDSGSMLCNQPGLAVATSPSALMADKPQHVSGVLAERKRAVARHSIPPFAPSAASVVRGR